MNKKRFLKIISYKNQPFLVKVVIEKNRKKIQENIVKYAGELILYFPFLRNMPYIWYKYNAITGSFNWDPGYFKVLVICVGDTREVPDMVSIFN